MSSDTINITTNNRIPAWEDQFRTCPDERSGYTMISCIHPYHGTEVFYLSFETWQANIKQLLTPYWINNYTVTMMPMD